MISGYGKFMLKGKVAVITGGTRGIGYATVKKFLENGAKVVLFGSRQETVDKALASLKQENAQWEVSGAWPNLLDADEVAKEIEKIKEKYGRIDILINNAGVSDSTPIDDYTSEKFAAECQCNYERHFGGCEDYEEAGRRLYFKYKLHGKYLRTNERSGLSDK